MDRIQMKKPIAELDGDEMTRVLWAWIKQELLEPFVDLNTEYYDLGLPNREATGDQVTIQAAAAIARLGIGVKCATITPNAARVQEYGLSKQWKSPNATLRAKLDGTVFRTPIRVSCITPAIPAWKAPITIARHAYGDIYKAEDYQVSGPGKAELYITSDSGDVKILPVAEFREPGVVMGEHNFDSSIRSFARSCFQYAVDQGQDLWFSAKDTILKLYDSRFRTIFQEEYEQTYRAAFEQKGLTYFYTLIDDAVSRAVRSEGGFIWALKNYDGDVMSDMVSAAFGSLAMMTSVLVSPNGCFEYEAAHGTVTRHYYRYLRGEETSTNPVATIFAWTGALKKSGQRDQTPELCDFAERLERAALDTIESGIMTGDLAALAVGDMVKQVNTLDFLRAVRSRLQCP